MALSPAFTCVSFNTPLINPSLGGTVDPSAMILADTSSGSDVNIASRKILLYDYQNNLFGSFAWPLASNPFTINPLTQDIALNVVIQWLDVSGNVLYTANQILPFTGYGEQFKYGLIQTEVTNEGILQDVNYQSYFNTLSNYLDGAIQAIIIGQSIGNSQSQIVKEKFLVINSNNYY